jgi:RNA polymerase sigma factor (sigma-70 family)
MLEDRQGRTAEDAVLRIVQEHAAELLRFARRFSHCADDAHDAYQRSLEILVRRMRVEPPAEPLRWVRTVLRHEALAIREQRERHVNRSEVDFDRHEAREEDGPAERALRLEQVGQAAEALQRLKPHELTALVLRAEGLSYNEICERTGWSYRRCNRAIYEGRRALATRFEAIRSGAECERWQPLLSALADGEAGWRELAELRPHLRACAGCRATLRGFHAAPAHVAALVPAAVVPLAPEPGLSLIGQVELALHAVADRTTLAAMRVQGAFEGLTGTKLAAVAASTAAVAGGGAAIEQAVRSEGAPRPADAATVADAPLAVTGSGGLAPFLNPLRRAGTAGVTRRARRASASRREFGPPDPTAPSEFAPRAERAEFASAVAPAASAVARAAPAASATARPASAPAPPPRPPSEFGGP